MPATTLAAVLVDELIRCGVADAVLCPGSRSAPLAYALAEADAGGRLRLHVRVDERSAGFLALGLAKATGRVVPVVTTSGTAVANLHPAILEADAAAVPVLALTADRPPELRGTGANQTADQVKLFGGAVRWWHELGTPYDVRHPEEPPGAPGGGSPSRAAALGPQAAAWRTAVDRVVAVALGAGGRPGPVHVNVPLREPLAPGGSGPHVPAGAGEPSRFPAGRADGRPWTSVADGSSAASALTPVTEALTDEPRTLVLLGDLGGAWGGRPLGGGVAAAYRAVLTWAAQAGFPVLAEPFGPRGVVASGAVAPGPAAPDTVLPHGRLLAAGPDLVPGLAPRRIIVVGRLTLSRPVAALLRRADTEVVIAGGRGRWADPSHVAHRVIDLVDLVALGDDVATPPADGGQGGTNCAHAGPATTVPRGRPAGEFGWFAAWRRAAEAVHLAVASSLVSDFPHGPSVVATVLGALPTGSRLFLGSSTVPRDAEVARTWDGADVWASRGLAGIDGCLSTAIGLALAAPDVPTYALMGDLTFLHDGNGLLIGPDEPAPDLTVVVLNDDGGAIFGTLEYGEPERVRDPRSAAAFRRVFTTPTGADLQSHCAAHNVRHVLVRSAVELAEAVSRRPYGVLVVEVDASGRDRRAHERMLADRAAQALGGVAGSADPRP